MVAGEFSDSIITKVYKYSKKQHKREQDLLVITQILFY